MLQKSGNELHRFLPRLLEPVHGHLSVFVEVIGQQLGDCVVFQNDVPSQLSNFVIHGYTVAANYPYRARCLSGQ